MRVCVCVFVYVCVCVCAHAQIGKYLLHINLNISLFYVITPYHWIKCFNNEENSVESIFCIE